MPRFLIPVLFLVLALVGYAAGSRFDRPTSAVEKTEEPEGEQITRKLAPQSIETFGQARTRLDKIEQSVGKVGGYPFIVEGKRHGDDLVALEQIFALATREDLIDFFAEEDAGERKPAVLSAAYTRLAELSPEEAVAFWSDQFQRTGNDAGVDGLVRAWAGQDPAAVELWIDALPATKTRDTALFNFLDAIAIDSPQTVERRITEVSDLFQSLHLATILGRESAPERLAPMANQFLAENGRNWKYQNQLAVLLEAWGERDDAAMMAWVMKQPPGSFQDHVLPRVAQARAESDPAAFAREIGPSLAGNAALADMAGLAWLQWLEKDEDGKDAMAWFATHGEHLQSTQGAWWTSRNWSAEKAARVLPKLLELPDGNFKSKLSRTILWSLSRTDPLTAIGYARELIPPGHDSDNFIASSLSSLARNGEPEKALNWALQNLESGQGQEDAVRWVMSPLVDQDPFAAIQQAVALPEKLRERAYDGIAYRWAETKPDQLLQFLQSGKNPAAATALARDSFWSFGYHRGGENYLSAALEIPDEAMRNEAVDGLFGGWSRANLEASGEALNNLHPGPLRDVAILRYVSSAASTDRAAALVWSLEIGDDAKRRTTTLQQSRYWLKADRAAAENWIENNESMPEAWKNELLKPGE